MDRCDVCRLWNIQTTDRCPNCGDIIDLCIEGLTLSWKCRKCDYGVATTANKLCILDNGNFSEESYSKINSCPYGKRK